MDRRDDHTFVVLAYRESPHLCECIESLLSQTARSRLLLSTSTPSEFLGEVSARYGIPLRVNASAAGIASDWSFAYRQAATPCVTLAHQDDVYLAGYTRAVLSLVDRHADALIAFCDYGELRDGERTYRTRNLSVKRVILAPFFLGRATVSGRLPRRWMLSLGTPICCPSVMFNRRALGDFRFRDEFRVNMDWDAWLRLADMKGRFAFDRRRLVLHRVHPGSETSAGLRSNTRQEEDLLLFRRIWPEPIARLLARLYARSYRSNSGA